jgi:hypothetical protein
MSHVFISYSHADKDKLNRLVRSLEKYGFTTDEIWYDSHIKPGGDWRDEIEVKLSEAFVVVVIVTRKAMCSTYVTYEWSWAIGNGTPVIPLLFEDIPFTKVHSRLGKLHHMDCIKDITNDCVEEINSLRTTAPDTIYLNRLIIRTVTALRVVARVSFWLCKYAEADILHPDNLSFLFGSIFSWANYASSELTKLLVEKAYAFTTKQKLKCKFLIARIDGFSQIKASTSLYVIQHPSYLETVPEFERYRKDELEPAISYFAQDIDSINNFQGLDLLLENITKSNLDLISKIFIQSSLDEQLAHELITAIETVKNYEIHRQKG